MNNYKNYLNNSVIERYIQSEKVERNSAIEHFNALKQFLRLCSSTKLPCFPSKQLDEIWHTFILFTKDYYFFCKKILGKFVHHNPFSNELDKIKSFEPGYFCYIENKKMKKIFVKNLTQLETIYKTNCGSDGKCTTCSNCNEPSK